MKNHERSQRLVQTAAPVPVRTKAPMPTARAQSGPNARFVCGGRDWHFVDDVSAWTGSDRPPLPASLT